jgi:branched-subunit amino acid aminotransferase/4-amino-4-deoxychorismate lyase
MNDKMISDSTEIQLGCFETMLGFKGQIPLIRHHFSRLQRGLDWLNWVRPEDLSAESVNAWFADKSDSSDDTHWRVRLCVDRMGNKIIWNLTKEAITHPSEPFTLATVHVKNEFNSVHEQLCKLAERTLYDQSLARAKTSAAHDALLITSDGIVSETCIAGVLALKNGRFYTPGVQSGGLRGVGLEVLKPLLISDLSTIKERSFDLDFLFQADSVWLVNALRGPFPVQCIDGKDVHFDSDMHQKVYELYWRRVDELLTEGH